MTAVVFIAVLLAVATWSGGGTEPWTRAAMLAAVACGAGIIVRGRRQADVVAGRRTRLAGAGTLVLVLFFAATQAINPSHVLPASSDHLQPLAHIRWLPHSVHAPATWQALLTLATTAVLYWIAAHHIPLRHQSGLLLTLAANAFVLAIVAMLMRPVGGGRHLNMGPFLNENNYAAYVNVLVPLVLSGAADIHARAGQHENHPAYLLYFVAACLLASVAISESRAGMAIGVLLMVAWLLLEGWRLASTRARHAAQALLVPAIMGGGLLVLLGAGALTRQLSTLAGQKLDIAIEMRTLAAQGTWSMFRANAGLGVGAGTFSQAFPYYQPEQLSGYFRHAHNDWLQTLAEWGTVGCALLVLALVVNFPPVWRCRVMFQQDRVATGFALALAGLALHACVDFPMQIPVISMLAATLAGLLCHRARDWESKARALPTVGG